MSARPEKNSNNNVISKTYAEKGKAYDEKRKAYAHTPKAYAEKRKTEADNFKLCFDAIKLLGNLSGYNMENDEHYTIRTNC